MHLFWKREAFRRQLAVWISAALDGALGRSLSARSGRIRRSPAGAEAVARMAFWRIRPTCASVPRSGDAGGESE